MSALDASLFESPADRAYRGRAKIKLTSKVAPIPDFGETLGD